jgi:hypothetical protein
MSHNQVDLGPCPSGGRDVVGNCCVGKLPDDRVHMQQNVCWLFAMCLSCPLDAAQC